MPDPIRKTISATEASVLFEVNPFVTPWMLWRKFATGAEAYVPPHSRMTWGKKLEPLILEAAAEDLKFEVRPNEGPDGNQVYFRNGLFGCMRDADIINPSRGPGACEAKCVFEYRDWMMDWKGGNTVPHHYEIQLQTQMKVGDGTKPYEWGVLAVWVAGQMHYFERQPIPKFWEAMDIEAKRFFDSIKQDKEPEPFGTPREYPLIKECFPIVEEKVLDLRDNPDGLPLAELVRMYDYHSKQKRGHEKGADGIKLKVAIAAKENETILLPHGIVARIKHNKTGVGLKVHIPQDLPEGELDGD